MRPTLLAWCLNGVVFLVLAVSSRSHAQAYDGAFRLFLDTGLVSYTMGRDPEDGVNTLAVGPGVDAFSGGTGIGLGYAVTPSLIPLLYVGFEYLALTASDGDGARYIDDDERIHAYQLELRPALELRRARPKSQWFVPQATLGLALMIRDRPQGSSYDGGFDPVPLRVFGVGPTLALGAHLFALPRASVDLSLAFRQLFLQVLDGERALTKKRLDETVVMLTLGASFWLGGEVQP